jgi:outer membrane protein assembly factor BamB
MIRFQTSIASRGIRGLLLSLLALLLLLPSSLAAGQEGPGEEEEEFDPRVYLDTDEDADGLLRAAWRARENGNWRMVIEKYLKTIRMYDKTVFAANERLYLPMRQLVRKELSELPKEGRAVYRLIKGREADLAYRRAVAGSDFEALKRIANEYPCLPAAPRALYLLGEWYRARGEPGRALHFWRQLMAEYPDWEEGSRAALLTRAALVAAEAGRAADGQRLLGLLKKTSGLTRLRVGTREELVADLVGKRLKSGGSGTAVTKAIDAGYWPTIGGSPAHCREVPRMVDAGVRRWQNALGAAKKPVNSRRVSSRYRPPTPASPVAKRHPVCAGGMVFLAGDDTVMAVRAVSGSEVWAAGKGKVDRKLGCSRMALPAVGDNKVFVVQGRATQQSVRRWGGRQPQTKSSDVKLRAYALTGGKLRWESGRFDDKKVKEFLKGVDLVSMPVYDSGYVYCPAVKRGSINDVYMCCFEASSGKLVWKTFVCAGYPTQAGYSYNAVSVLEDALPPAISEGLIAFVTNVGAVSVMDAASGQLLWVYLYDRLEAPKTDRFGRSTRTTIKSWAPSPPIIWGGLFICAPQDSPHLLAFDMSSGKVRWRSRRASLRHLVGISGGVLVTSGGKEIVGFSARSGKRLWRGRLEDEEAGLGIVGRGFAVIPTKRGLQRFDLKTGKLVAKYRFKNGTRESGNLLISGDVLVSVSNQAFGGYYGWKEITDKLAGQIKAAPDAAKPRAELGEVYFSADKYVEAAKIFKAALKRAKPNETTDGVALVPVLKRQIWESFSRLGRAEEKSGKFDTALGRYQEAHKYTVDDGTRMVGHMRFARCREKLDKAAVAVSELHIVLDRYPRELYKTRGRKTVARSFAKTEIDRLIKAKGREVYAPFDRKAAELLAAADSVEKARKVVEAFPNSSSVSPGLIKLSELHTAKGKHADAAASLREHLYKRRGAPRELEVRARLALAYKAQGINGLSRSVIRQMQRRNADGVFTLAAKDWTVKAFVAKHMPDVEGPGEALPAPRLTPPMTTAWKSTPGGSVQLVLNASKYELTGAAFLVVNRREVQAIDLTTGKQLWRKAGPQGAGIRVNLTALATSGVILAAAGNRLRALSPATGEITWEVEVYKAQKLGRNVGGTYSQLAAGDGVVGVAATYRTRDARGRFLYKTKVAVIDEGSGRKVWSVDLPGRISKLKLVDGTLIAAGYDQTGRKGFVKAYEIADGSVRFSAQLASYPQEVVTGGGLAAIADQKNVSCYDLATGKLKWRASAGGRYQRILAADDSKIVVLGQNYGNRVSAVCAFDFESGKRLWTGPKLTNIRYNINTSGGGTDYLLLSAYDSRKRTTTVVGIDGKNGKMKWKSTLPVQSYVYGSLIGQQHGAAVVRLRKGRAYVYERRIWNMKNGKLVEKKSLAIRHSYLRVHEGVVMQVSNVGIECLRPSKPKSPGKKK